MVKLVKLRAGLDTVDDREHQEASQPLPAFAALDMRPEECIAVDIRQQVVDLRVCSLKVQQRK